MLANPDGHSSPEAEAGRVGGSPRPSGVGGAVDGTGQPSTEAEGPAGAECRAGWAARGQCLTQEALEVTFLLGQAKGLPRLELESRDKTHTLVPCPRRLGARRLRLCRPGFLAHPTPGR